MPEVVDDFEIAEEEMLKISERPENIAKVAKRIEKYEFKKKFHDFREGKKLLVLDIDYTLFGKCIILIGHKRKIEVYGLYNHTQWEGGGVQRHFRPCGY